MLNRNITLIRIIWLIVFVLFIYQEYSYMMEGRNFLPIRWVEDLLFKNENYIKKIDTKTYLLSNSQLELLYRGNFEVLKESTNREGEELNLVILIHSKGTGWGTLGWRLNSRTSWNKLEASSFKDDFYPTNTPFYQIYTYSLQGINVKDLDPKEIEIKWFSMNTKA
jgi:hypothetical protein